MILAKILLLDIETKPTLAYVWKAFKENIGYEQVVEPGGIICFAAKWLDDKDTVFYSNWTHTQGEMVRAAHDLLSEADAVVHYNGKKFDIPHLLGEFLLEGLPPLPPLVQIDCLEQVKKNRFFMNRLAFIGPLLRVGDKVKHEGFELWKNVLAGNDKARKKMEKYNIGDVTLLERLYKKIRPYMLNHPHVGDHGECGNCGSNKSQLRGFYRTKMFRVQRVQCSHCGAWRTGKREKIK